MPSSKKIVNFITLAFQKFSIPLSNNTISQVPPITVTLNKNVTQKLPLDDYTHTGTHKQPHTIIENCGKGSKPCLLK